jgi:hypothetical protein
MRQVYAFLGLVWRYADTLSNGPVVGLEALARGPPGNTGAIRTGGAANPMRAIDSLAGSCIEWRAPVMSLLNSSASATPV